MPDVTPPRGRSVRLVGIAGRTMSPGRARRPQDVADDVSGERVVLYRGGTEVAGWPLESGRRLDLGTVDELARLQLMAPGPPRTRRTAGWPRLATPPAHPSS